VRVNKREDSVPFVLASASPRRRMLLGMIGLRHRVLPPVLSEGSIDCDEPLERVRRLAREKALKVSAGLDEGIVLGADTLVVREGEILEKPRSREDAVRMLTLLSNGWHEVFTGIHLVDAGSGREVSGEEVSRVKFRSLDLEAIHAYLDTGEPMDKAGSYGIQGFGAVFIERIEGCYFNIVGLPLGKLMTLLGELGLVYDFKELRRKERG
jgi:septum formation protein